MGVDIYVRWGRQEDTETEESWPDFPAERAEEQHGCGFTSGPQFGYLRESWGSMRWVREMAEQLKAPNPYDFFPNWEGSNGEHVVCDAAGLAAVLAFRDEKLRPWLRDRAARDTFYAEARAKKDAQPLPSIPNKPTHEEMMTAIAAEEARWEELTGDYVAFRARMADVIGFLNFVELHQAEPGLTICFY